MIILLFHDSLLFIISKASSRASSLIVMCLKLRLSTSVEYNLIIYSTLISGLHEQYDDFVFGLFWLHRCVSSIVNVALTLFCLLSLCLSPAVYLLCYPKSTTRFWSRQHRVFEADRQTTQPCPTMWVILTHTHTHTPCLLCLLVVTKLCLLGWGPIIVESFVRLHEFAHKAAWNLILILYN